MFNFQIKKWTRPSALEDSCFLLADYNIPPTPTGYHYLDFLLITVFFIVLPHVHLFLNNLLFGFGIIACIFFDDLILLDRVIYFSFRFRHCYIQLVCTCTSVPVFIWCPLWLVSVCAAWFWNILKIITGFIHLLYVPV